MKTGETFKSVQDYLWVGSDRPADWRHKRRHSVLGLWHQLKLAQWNYHIEQHERGTDRDSGEGDGYVDELDSDFEY
jgi:hypothetical protein